MARANRHFLPGYIWHVTQRCHRQQFLLRFARDRDAWVDWLFEARKRFGLSVLDYTVTSNHVHLIVFDQGRDEIAGAMQLIAGCDGQQYNRRKGRRGAFWEDRYHATAIESGEHLARCVAYVDLNMVRAGVVTHPSQWRWGGYHEIHTPKQRYRIIDRERLAELLGLRSADPLAETHEHWVQTALGQPRPRQPQWSESVAVGSRDFVHAVAAQLGNAAKGRTITAADDFFCLRDADALYTVRSTRPGAERFPQHTVMMNTVKRCIPAPK